MRTSYLMGVMGLSASHVRCIARYFLIIVCGRNCNSTNISSNGSIIILVVFVVVVVIHYS